MYSDALLSSGKRNEMSYVISPHFLWSKISNSSKKTNVFPYVTISIAIFADIEILNLFYTIISFVYPELRSIQLYINYVFHI